MQTCSTHTAAFDRFGISDGSDLVAQTHYHLASNGHRSPEPTAEFVDRVASAFRRAFIRAADVPLVPDPITVAIDDAADVLVQRILDDPGADLRTDLLPTFYRVVASTYCVHLEGGGDPGAVGIWYVDGDGRQSGQ